MLLGAGLVGCGALIMCMVNSKAPSANLPQGAVVLVMVRGLLIAMKTVGKVGRGLLTLVLGARERANVTLADHTALHAVSAFSWSPLTFSWALGREDMGNEVSGRGRWLSCHEMVLDPRLCLTMDQVLLYKDHFTISFLFLCI